MTFVKPMLAKSSSRESLDRPGAWDDYLLEPKHDGMRAVVVKDHFGGVEVYSRSGKTYAEHVPHLVELFSHLPPGTVLDGELGLVEGHVKVHDELVPVFNFNKTMSIMGSLPERSRNLQINEHGNVSFMLFDVVHQNGELVEVDQVIRNEMNLDVFDGLHRPGYVKINPVYSDVEDFGTIYDELISHNIEGTILKNKNGLYLPGKRPNKTWYKTKVSKTFDVVVTGFYEGTGKHKGRLGGVRVGAYDGDELVHVCRVGGGFTDVMREDIWNNQEEYLGKVCEIKCNDVVGSKKLTPRHPQLSHFRVDKLARECSYSQFEVVNV